MRKLYVVLAVALAATTVVPGTAVTQMENPVPEVLVPKANLVREGLGYLAFAGTAGFVAAEMQSDERWRRNNAADRSGTGGYVASTIVAAGAAYALAEGVRRIRCTENPRRWAAVTVVAGGIIGGTIWGINEGGVGAVAVTAGGPMLAGLLFGDNPRVRCSHP